MTTTPEHSSTRFSPNSGPSSSSAHRWTWGRRTTSSTNSPIAHSGTPTATSLWTALTLSKPEPGSDLEARLLDPILDRLWPASPSTPKELAYKRLVTLALVEEELV